MQYSAVQCSAVQCSAVQCSAVHYPQTALFLPETLHKHLPNTLEEGETFGTKFKIFSCPSRNRSALLNRPKGLQPKQNCMTFELYLEIKTNSKENLYFSGVHLRLKKMDLTLFENAAYRILHDQSIGLC